MRHKQRGRKLGRNASHRKAMFRNMACSLIRSVRVDEDDVQKPKVEGRIVTTLPKAKELRPYVEKLITLARRARAHEERAEEYATTASRDSEEWQQWRKSQQWNEWNQAIAPALAVRRRIFAILRDNEAVDILLNELAERFEDRPGGYTRVARLAAFRLGDAGRQAIIEFVGDGDRDRVRRKRQAPMVTDEDESAEESESATATATEEGEEVEASQAEAGESTAEQEQAAAESEGEEDGEETKP